MRFPGNRVAQSRCWLALLPTRHLRAAETSSDCTTASASNCDPGPGAPLTLFAPQVRVLLKHGEEEEVEWDPVMAFVVNGARVGQFPLFPGKGCCCCAPHVSVVGTRRRVVACIIIAHRFLITAVFVNKRIAQSSISNCVATSSSLGSVVVTYLENTHSLAVRCCPIGMVAGGPATKKAGDVVERKRKQ